TCAHRAHPVGCRAQPREGGPGKRTRAIERADAKARADRSDGAANDDAARAVGPSGDPFFPRYWMRQSGLAKLRPQAVPTASASAFVSPSASAISSAACCLGRRLLLEVCALWPPAAARVHCPEYHARPHSRWSCCDLYSAV